jgi:hypothetical protein
MPISIEEAHHSVILSDAADIANRKAAEEYDPTQKGNAGPEPNEERSGFIAGALFRPDPGRSTKGGLALSVDPFVFGLFTRPQQERVREIGREAIREAIIANQDLFVGLILGEARQGRNYFDRFIEEGEQMQLRLS